MDYHSKLQNLFPGKEIVGCKVTKSSVPAFPLPDEALTAIQNYYALSVPKESRKPYYTAYIAQTLKKGRKDRRKPKDGLINVIGLNKAEVFFFDLYMNPKSINLRKVIADPKHSAIRKDLKKLKTIDLKIKKYSSLKKQLNKQKRTLLDKAKKIKAGTIKKLKNASLINDRKKRAEKKRSIRKQKQELLKRLGLVKIKRNLARASELITKFKDKKSIFIYSVRTIDQILLDNLNRYIEQSYADNKHLLLGIDESVKLDGRKKYYIGFTGNSEEHQAKHSKLIIDKHKTKEYKRVLKKIRFRKKVRTLYDLESGEFNEFDLVEVKLRQIKPYYERIEKVKKKVAVLCLIDCSKPQSVEQLYPLYNHPAVTLEVIGFKTEAVGESKEHEAPPGFFTRGLNEKNIYYHFPSIHTLHGLEFSGTANYGEALLKWKHKIVDKKEKKFVLVIGTPSGEYYTQQKEQLVRNGIYVVKSVEQLVAKYLSRH